MESLETALIRCLCIRVFLLGSLFALGAWYELQSQILPSWHVATVLKAVWPLVLLLVVSGLNVIGLHYTDKELVGLERRARRLGIVGYIQLLFDVVLSTVAMHVTGSPVCIALYLLAIIAAGALFGGHGAVIIAVGAAAGFAVLTLNVLPVGAGPQLHATPQDLLVLYVSLIAVALAAGYFTKRLEVARTIAETRGKQADDLVKHQRQLYDDLSEGIITVDLDSAITSINQAATAIMGLSNLKAQDFVGKPFRSVFRDFGLDEADPLLRCQFNDEQQGELSLGGNEQQSSLQLRYTTRPLVDSEGHLIGRIFVFSDVSHVRGMEERLRLHERMTQLLAETDARTPTPETASESDIFMVGDTPVMRQIFALVDRIAQSDASVLITGESGTGKELVARTIHASGGRAQKPFVALNCGAIPETLIESELFGHKKGAFTGAVADNPGLFRQAHGGTIFLDEIAELPLAMQSKLLRVLQERRVRAVGDVHDVPVDIRLVAATNRDLKKEILNGKFREDLFYRLNVVHIPLPPLRDRREDIPLFVRHFMSQFCDPDRVLPRISPEALQLLMSYSFPGNIRELENIVERAMVLGGSAILPEHLPEEVVTKSGRAPSNSLESTNLLNTEIITLPIDLEAELSKLERLYISQALAQAGGIKKQAAALLGLNFRSFRYRLKKLEMAGEQNTELNDNP